MNNWTLARISRYIIMIVFAAAFGIWLFSGVYNIYAQRNTPSLTNSDSLKKLNNIDTLLQLNDKEKDMITISGKDYIDGRIQIKNFDIDFAGLIVGAVGLLLTLLLLFTFKDLEKLEKLKTTIERSKSDIEKLKIEVENESKNLSKKIEDVLIIEKKYGILIDTDFLTFEDLFSRFLTALYQKKIVDIQNDNSIISEKDYNEITLAIAKAKINLSNETFKNQGLDIFFALGSFEDLPFLRNILLNENENNEYKKRVLNVIETINKRSEK